MKTGTKSVLFGVHAFWWHPITVARAWEFLYRRKPTWDELICIWVHDLGYWGCREMDGPDGKHHPLFGARLAEWLVYWRHRLLKRSNGFCKYKAAVAYLLTILHSSSYAKMHNERTSWLYLPDKACILCEPRWFYILRAWLSGELAEYVRNSPVAKHGWRVWYSWYVDRKCKEVELFFAEHRSCSPDR